MAQSTTTKCCYCGHVREPETLAPEWQCPACNTAYAKAQLRLENEQLHRQPQPIRTPTPVATRTGLSLPGWLWKGGLLLVLVFVLSRFISIEKNELPPPAVAAPAGEVWMFTRDSCGYCKKLKAELGEKGFTFTELNIDSDAHAKEMFDKLEAPGVPVTLVGDKLIVGYNPGEIVSAIKKMRKG